MRRPPRRWFLLSIATTGAGTLAGCSTLGADESPATPAYEYLADTPVFVADAVSLTLPDAVEGVADPADAGLVVVPATTDVAASTAVGWIADDKAVALVGDRAEATFGDWRDSDAYRSTFEAGGSADADPDPELLVAYTRDGDVVSTHNATWGHTDDPSDEELLDALEDSLRYKAEGPDATG